MGARAEGDRWPITTARPRNSLEFARGEVAQLTRDALDAARPHDFDAARELNTRAGAIMDQARECVAKARQQLSETQRHYAREAQAPVLEEMTYRDVALRATPFPFSYHR